MHNMAHEISRGLGFLLLTGCLVAGPDMQAAEQRVLFAVPLANETGQEQYDPAAEGLGDLVAALLAQQKTVTVVEREKLHLLKAEQLQSLRGLTSDRYAVQAGKVLKADTVLTGRLFLIGDTLTVSVKAIDIASERALAVQQFSCQAEGLPEAALQTARGLARQMALPLPAIDVSKIDTTPLVSLHFAQALSHYYAGNLDAAIMQFFRTLDLDPNFFEAHDYCGMCYDKLGEPEHAVIEWETLLRLQPDFRHAERVKQALAKARERAGQSNVPRLGPDTPLQKGGR